MDILLQNGANADYVVQTRRYIHHHEWGQAAPWECAKKGHKDLLDCMLDYGIDVNAVVRVPENLPGEVHSSACGFVLWQSRSCEMSCGKKRSR